MNPSIHLTYICIKKGVLNVFYIGFVPFYNKNKHILNMKALPTFKDLKRIKEEILEIASYLTSTLPEKFTLNTKEQFQAHIRFLLFQKFETNAQCKMQSTLKNMLTEWEDTRNSIAESYLYLVKQIDSK